MTQAVLKRLEKFYESVKNCQYDYIIGEFRQGDYIPTKCKYKKAKPGRINTDKEINWHIDYYENQITEANSKKNAIYNNPEKLALWNNQIEHYSKKINYDISIVLTYLNENRPHIFVEPHQIKNLCDEISLLHSFQYVSIYKSVLIEYQREINLNKLFADSE